MSAEEKDDKKSTSGEGASEKPKTEGAAKPKKKKAAAFDYRIPASSAWAGIWKLMAALAVLGLGASALGYTVDADRFAFSYLFGFIVALSVALGSLFFIIIERLTSAHWSVAVRRIAEFFASGFPALVVLFIPILVCSGTLFPWLHEKTDAKTEHHETSAVDPQELPGPVTRVQDRTAQARPAGAQPGPTGPRHVDGSHVEGRPDLQGMHHNPARPLGARPDPAALHERAVEAREGAALEAQEEQTMEKKAGYLNRNFFLVRIVFYFGAWLLLSMRYFRLSTGQDSTKDPSLTKKAQQFAPVATILFAITITFAAFDWLMSLDPSWFSTIFGVTFFAGCVVTIYATLTVVAMGLRESGLTKSAISIEHFHDLGKLLFGFLVFWAYVNFAQFMLIWYAALPEETTFYHHRWDVGPWATVSLLIVVAHFIVPFFILLSRNVKRRLPLLRVGAIWLLVMHVVEIYWLVMPNYNKGESSVSWIDVACLVGVVSAYLAFVFRNMTRYPLIPVGDPRLARSLAFENA